MSVVAKLKFLEAIKTHDSHGKDHITLAATSDVGPIRDAETSIGTGDKMLFEFYPRIQELLFDAQVKLVLFHYDDFSGHQYKLGSVFIVADEAGLGERKQQFAGEGADYELTYKVVAA